MAGVINEVVAGVLVRVIAETGRRAGTAMVGRRGRRHREDLEIVRWFDTYQLTDCRFEPSGLPIGVTSEGLADALREDELQAVLHELLAVRLTDAPEAEAVRVRSAFDLTLRAAFPGADVGVLGAELFDYYDAEICTLVGRLEGAEPDLLPQLRDEALAARMIATLHAIERHTAALSSRSDLQTESHFMARYRRHVAEHHGRLEPPDFERRRRIPIAELYVPPTIAQLIEAESGQPSREIDVWQLDSEIDRTVLLGDPGGGKTTAAHVLLHHHATGQHARTPFLVVLREFATRTPPERSVVGHIEHRLETFYQCPPPPGLVARLLLSGNALVVFDGLDELVDTSRRAEVTAIIERFCTEYPLARVLVTSRVVGYDQARLDDRQFVRYRVGGFDDDHVSEYVRKWFSQEEDIDADQSATSFMNESAGVSDLRSNPLMLALMCILYRGEGSIPRNRPEVYEQCANLLFRKWDARRSIHVELRARHLVEPALRHLAYWLFARDEAQAAVTERELIQETTGFLYERGFETTDEAIEAAREFVTFCRGRMWVFSDAGTTASGEALFTFTHRTFLEYFAAAHLAVTCDTPEKLARALAPRVARQEWEVVAELATQMKDRTSDRGAERLFSTLLGERRRRSVAGRSNVLQFLARCLKSVDPPPRTVRDLTHIALDHLFAGDPRQADRHEPVSWLVESCINCKDVVKDEIVSRVATMIESPDPATCVNGLRLGAWVWVCSFAQRGNHWPDHTLREFWEKFARDTLHTYSSAAIEAATHDTGLRFAALDAQVITMRQALTMEGGLTSLFQVHPTTIFGIRWTPAMWSYVHSLISGRSRSAFFDGGQLSINVMQEFESVGRYIIEYPRPPWVADPPVVPDRYLAGIQEGDVQYELPNPIAYLGSVVSLLIMAERVQEGSRSFDAPLQLGPLADANPYIAQRWKKEPNAILLDLPVPKDFQALLKGWANREVDFIRRSGKRS